jgi:hypothetical protein
MNGDLYGTIQGGITAVQRGGIVYIPHGPDVSCKPDCPGKMVSLELERTFIPQRAQDE